MKKLNLMTLSASVSLAAKAVTTKVKIGNKIKRQQN
jgi:hypothetical protein